MHIYRQRFQFRQGKAKSHAAAEAATTAEAHAGAYAEAYNGCGACDPDIATEATASASEVLASTFVEMTADVYVQSAIEVCVRDNHSSSAKVWFNCFGKAFTRINAKAVADSLVTGACQYAQAEVFVRSVTHFRYTNIQGCSQGDAGTENGSLVDSPLRRYAAPTYPCVHRPSLWLCCILCFTLDSFVAPVASMLARLHFLLEELHRLQPEYCLEMCFCVADHHPELSGN